MPLMCIWTWLNIDCYTIGKVRFFHIIYVYIEAYMNSIFDIIGPVMIGPSSSHTAGAARLGKMARRFGEE